MTVALEEILANGGNCSAKSTRLTNEWYIEGLPDIMTFRGMPAGTSWSIYVDDVCIGMSHKHNPSECSKMRSIVSAHLNPAARSTLHIINGLAFAADEAANQRCLCEQTHVLITVWEVLRCGVWRLKFRMS